MPEAPIGILALDPRQLLDLLDLPEPTDEFLDVLRRAV
jgi:hypothetical protein